MNEVRYFVEVDGSVYAQDMSIETATLLAKALFERYFNDEQMKVTIRRMDWNQESESNH